MEQENNTRDRWLTQGAAPAPCRPGRLNAGFNTHSISVDKPWDEWSRQSRIPTGAGNKNLNRSGLIL